MDIFGIRMRNYEVQFVEFGARQDQRCLPKHGQLVRFAQASGTSGRYLSHINNRRKRIGDALARQLELGLGLPSGYMDNVHEKQGEDDNESCDRPVGDAERKFVGNAIRLFRDNPLGVQEALLDYATRRTR